MLLLNVKSILTREKKEILYKSVKTWNKVRIPKLNSFKLFRPKVKNFVYINSQHLKRGYLFKLTIDC